MNNETHPASLSAAAKIFACAAIFAGTVMGLAGIDLVLPSVPEFPDIFDTSTAASQMILAAFVAGNMIGLISFGSLAAHFGRRKLFIASLFGYGLVSFGAAYSPSIEALIGTRFLQGLFASGSAVLAPGLIRHLFSELGAVRALSAMGSIESLVPGLAPIAGAWLHSQYGWTASFLLTSLLIGAIFLVVILRPNLLPHIGTKSNMQPGSYKNLIKNTVYLRYAMGHALVLGGLLTFVFTAPAVIVKTMNGSISDFIYMQVVGVSCFIVASNVAGNIVKRWGAEKVIDAGNIIAVIGALGLLAYAIWGRNDPADLKYIFWLLNVGLGLRGGAGFVQALKAAHDDDDRASALMLVAVTGLSAAMTAFVAPFIGLGLIALTIATCLIILPVLLLMIFIEPLEKTPQKTPQATGE